MDKKLILIIILLFAAAFLSAKLFAEMKNYNALKTEYDKSLSQIELLNNNIENLNKEKNNIQSQLNALRSDYKGVSQSYEEVNVSYNELVKESEKTIEKIDDYETELKESLSWFRLNSALDSVDEEEIVKRRLENCYMKKAYDCTIKSGCFYLINSEYLAIDYIYDYYTSGVSDKLQSLNDFFNNEGGDCEDYSLFYKAEFNHILDECGERDIIVEGWVSDIEGGKYNPAYKGGWYISNAKEVGFDVKYPNVICGYLYDLNTGQTNGHCMIAFTKYRIETVDDIDELDLAPIIEPQNGMYMGMINTASSGIHLSSSDDVYKYASYINVVITDYDFFLFSKDKEWLSYSVLHDELGERKESLVGFKT